MTMTKPNASADAKKNHTGYYKKALQRRKCSNSSAKYRTYHGTELLRTEHKAKNASALVGSCIAGQNRTQRRLNTGTAQAIAKLQTQNKSSVCGIAVTALIKPESSVATHNAL